MVDRKHMDTVREHTISCRTAGLAQALRREAILGGRWIAPGTWSAKPSKHYTPLPLRGSGTDDVLRELAGLAPADIAALRTDGVVGRRPRSNGKRLDALERRWT